MPLLETHLRSTNNTVSRRAGTDHSWSHNLSERPLCPWPAVKAGCGNLVTHSVRPPRMRSSFLFSLFSLLRLSSLTQPEGEWAHRPKTVNATATRRPSIGRAGLQTKEPTACAHRIHPTDCQTNSHLARGPRDVLCSLKTGLRLLSTGLCLSCLPPPRLDMMRVFA